MIAGPSEIWVQSFHEAKMLEALTIFVCFKTASASSLPEPALNFIYFFALPFDQTMYFGNVALLFACFTIHSRSVFPIENEIVGLDCFVASFFS
jgi:hypothetical protein